ncbi:kinase-like domain-containing protein [Aspergillus varians]
MRLEAKIYALIGEDPYVPRMIYWSPETCCLTMEYLENGNLKEYTAKALSVLHDHQVIPCDLSPRNFLDSDLNIKIADFGGASLCVFGDDIFSLGSLIYFIMTGSYPYRDIPSNDVEELYEVQQFPDISSITELIQNG